MVIAKRALRLSELVANAGAAMLLLLVATAPFGRKQRSVVSQRPRHQRGAGRKPTAKTGWVRVFWITVIVLVLLFLIKHFTGAGLASHMR